MASSLFSDTDRRILEARGLTEDDMLSQIATFEQGIPFTVLDRPCTVGDGITALQPDALQRYGAVYGTAALAGRTMKFVPASGAASRMFQALLAFQSRTPHGPLDSPADASDPEVLRCLQNLKQFAFYDDLKAVLARDGYDIETLAAQGHYQDIFSYLLTPQGLDYANRPKALLNFHRYPDHCRTPLEEHLVEAAAYTQDHRGTARLQFTVTPAHQEALQRHLQEVRPRHERAGVHFEVSFSTQQLATDTLAVDLHNRPFRDQEGQLLFRPGGHGALLVNLQELDGDIVFIKNIDNVVPDRLKPETYLYKRALGGLLVEVQQQLFAYLHQLESDGLPEAVMSEMFAFSRRLLSIVPPEAVLQQSLEARRQYLHSALNRPLRVCGMVKNAGEPGGGPFWVRHADGSLSLQIVEMSQVDRQHADQATILAGATHFNPVDLVCGVRDHQGKPFELHHFSDPHTGFISLKSHHGQDLKALELPGLWNGAMGRWNTVFVEVPLSTFNPVKTVADLLRPQHQP